MIPITAGKLVTLFKKSDKSSMKMTLLYITLLYITL